MTGASPSAGIFRLSTFKDVTALAEHAMSHVPAKGLDAFAAVEPVPAATPA